MVEKIIIEDCNVLDFRSYQQLRRYGSDNDAVRRSSALVRTCRHCGAALLDGESDDDCSSAGVAPPALRTPPRRFYAE
ncbi:MAG: hypothetical protein BGN91_15985 [Nitrobacter sp. 62-13]|jgi:hypothetical protein|uniref:hypothetical protein n=1 Tax=Nitrobacter sp. 62-13 TaxID=1895797 RepID=UPI00095DBE56|nr:hypothetical protein [Nitrobacter sp. 62-13]OJU25437.1 MAG: hypothetical protein BGN91_15985 [Nitrobacter sp. 62-13]